MRIKMSMMRRTMAVMIEKRHNDHCDLDNRNNKDSDDNNYDNSLEATHLESDNKKGAIVWRASEKEVRTPNAEPSLLTPVL